MKRGMLIVMLMVCGFVMAEVSPYMGLWVGSASLVAVNEVSEPYNADNVKVSPDPLVATPTGDRADIRLIIHVNAAGQVSLLKDVAIINRNASGEAAATAAEIAAAGSDEFAIALVMDPALYVEYPMRKATRYTSAVFDFGDAKATAVLDALVDKAVDYAVATVKSKTPVQMDSAVKRNQIVEDIVAEAKKWSVSADDVATSYLAFFEKVKTQMSLNPSIPTLAGLPAEAQTLANASTYSDTRALELVKAVQAAGNAVDKWNAAADWADVGREAPRLLSSQIAGIALAGATAYAATNSAATLQNLRDLDSSAALISAALASKGTWDNDTRATGAVEAMFAAIFTKAQAGHSSGDIAMVIQASAIKAGQDALLEAQSKMKSTSGPSDGYTAFVTSDAYKAVATNSALAAANAALLERRENPLTYTATLTNVAKAAAMNALSSTYAVAARVKMNELPLKGNFALGQGDARFTMELGTNVLHSVGLTGQIILPANFPTNPFRHRRHPDHTQGVDITRNIRFDFDASEAEGLIPSLTRGVETVSGMYREEVLGLHKPLGPEKDIGLRTEGRFTLNRISTISTLNSK